MFNFKLEQNQIQANRKTALGLVIEVQAPTVEPEVTLTHAPRGLVFVIDRSGSMGGGRLDSIKKTLLETLPRLQPNDEIAIITFDDRVERILDPIAVSRVDMPRLRNSINSLETRGSTNLFDAYRLACQTAVQMTSVSAKNIIVLTDGHANVGTTEPAEFAQVALRHTEHLITTTTIGIGLDYDERILDVMADRGRGNHLAAIERAELFRAFESELDDLLAPAVSGLRLYIHPNWAVLDTARIKSVNEKDARHEYPSVLQVHIDSMAVGEVRTLIFELDIEAKDAIAQEGLFLIEAIADAGLEATASGAVLVDVVDENSWVQPARNEDVVAELSIFRLQQARERAIELIELGRTYEADQLLRQAGLDVDELKKLIGLSERTRNRVHQSSNEFESYLGMSLEEKKKRLYEAKNRSMRNRRDFRDEK